MTSEYSSLFTLLHKCTHTLLPLTTLTNVHTHTLTHTHTLSFSLFKLSIFPKKKKPRHATPPICIGLWHTHYNITDEGSIRSHNPQLVLQVFCWANIYALTVLVLDSTTIPLRIIQVKTFNAAIWQCNGSVLYSCAIDSAIATMGVCLPCVCVCVCVWVCVCDRVWESVTECV